MATRTWTPFSDGSDDDASNWGGTLPAAGDTAVVASPGGGPPSPLQAEFLTSIGAASEVSFFVFPQYPVLIDATLAQVPLGDTVGAETIDFRGGGGYTASDLRRTTLSSASTLNVSGTSVMQATFDNTLDGTIDIGDPAATVANVHGFLSELDLNQYGLGSFGLDGGLMRRSYTPTVTNGGTITVADTSSLNIEQIVGPGSASQTLTSFGTLMTTAGAIDGWATFVNDGLIAIAPGSALRLDDDGTGYGGLINSGQIRIAGAQGVSSTSSISADILGPGLITVDGGTQADPAATTLRVSGTLQDTNVAVHDATLFALDENFVTRDVGGSLDMRGGAVLRLSLGGDGSITPVGVASGSPRNTLGLADPYGMPIYGFGAGDTIEIDGGGGVEGGHDPGPGATTPVSSTIVHDRFGSGSTTYTAYTAWNQATGQLTLGYTTTAPQEVLDPNTGIVTYPEETSAPRIAGTFTLVGSYVAADFHAALTLGVTADASGNTLVLDEPGYVAPEVMVTTTQAAPAYAVTAVAGATGTTFVTPVAGANLVTASAAGNDVVNSQGSDTVDAGGGTDIVYASGPSATVNGGTGSLVFVAGNGGYTAGGGAGTDILYGGGGGSVLTGGAGRSSVIVAGSGNTSLVGGAGSAALMYGGQGTSTFTGSAGGGDTMVGGAAGNVFAMTGGGVAFGGPAGPDTFDAGTGTALIVEGPGTTQVVLGGGNATAFAGTGADTYTFSKGLGGVDSIIGLKASDHLVLTGGFTAGDVGDALGRATGGAFGTQLHLADGTQVTLFGVTLAASQISAA